MSPRYLGPVAIVVLLLLARVWMATGGTTPAGQPPLADVRTLDALRAEFNRDAAKMRVLLSLAATCPYCLKGATGIEQVLARHHDYPLVVYNVWQPVLPTDWGQPGTGALARLANARVRQFWDGNRLVARAVEHSSLGRALQPNCCFERGLWWDFIAVYAPGGHWTDKLPEPLLLDGTVEDAIPAFEALLTKAHDPSASTPSTSCEPTNCGDTQSGQSRLSVPDPWNAGEGRSIFRRSVPQAHRLGCFVRANCAVFPTLAHF